MKLVIIGSGGHAGVVLDAVYKIGAWDIEGLLDETLPPGGHKHGQLLLDYSEILANGGAYKFHVAIGNNALRERFSKIPGLSLISILHPSSYQADKVQLDGSFFAVNSVVGHGSYVGRGCIMALHPSCDRRNSILANRQRAGFAVDSQ
jgi:hypothetical protein